MALRLAVGSLLVAASDALVLGTRARGVVRAPSACADLSAFEKSFMDQADIVDYLDKNRALCELKEAMPSLLSKGDGAELRRGIDKAREAGASVAELKKFVEGLKKVDPNLVTATDEAILLGAEQVVIASAPKPATKPPDSYLTDEQFQTLLSASKSSKVSWETNAPGGYDSNMPEDLQGAWGKSLIFFSLLRHPTNDPTPVVWDAVRKRWPLLEGVPDEELQKNLVECRKEFCDARFDLED